MADPRQKTADQWTDRPIRSSAEDILGRAPFAASLANAITRWKGDDSLVVALYGSWGSGKTSVKNMILEALEKTPQSAIVVEFSPWQWASQHRMFEAFFATVAHGLGKKDGPAEARRVAAKWRNYAATLTFAAAVPNYLKPIFLFLTAIFIALGLSASFVLEPSALRWVLFTAALVFAILAASARLTSGLAELLTTRAQSNEDSLDETREALVRMLKGLRRPILIVMDDIDRLTSTEVRQIMQLVKANADFPGVAYLLLFQRDIVERALSDEANRGADYLAKIVQIGYDIPAIEPARLERVLMNGLEEILGFPEANRFFQRDRWSRMFSDGIRPYFRTIRDVRRFLPILHFHSGLLRNDSTVEFNPIDLITLETLRVFEPSVYHQLFRQKHMLTATATEAKGQVASVTSSLTQAAVNSSAAMINLMGLFPQVATALNRLPDRSDETERYRYRRVSHPDVFDRYFHLTLPEGDISAAEIEALVAAPDRTTIATALKSLADRGLIAVALNRLDNYKSEIPRETAVPMMTGLFDIGESLPDKPTFWGGLLSAEGHARRIVYWILQGESHSETRARLLREAILGSSGLFLPVSYVGRYDEDIRSKEEAQEPDFPSGDLDFLRNILLGRIREHANNGRLEKAPGLGFTLSRWRRWGEPQEPRDWVSGLTTTSRGALTFLAGMAGRQSSIQGVKYFFELKDMTLYVPFESVEKSLAGIDPATLSEDEQALVMAFRHVVERRKRGLPDDPLHLYLDEK